MKRLLMVALLGLLALTTMTTATTKPTHAQEMMIDCDLAGSLCRQVSAAMYNLCMDTTHNPTECALQEANSTINCIKGAGCSP